VPSLDDFVAGVHRQIERYTGTHGAERTHVEVEVADGERLTLRSISPEPGYGFLTLSVHEANGHAEERIVPIGTIRRISLGPADESRRPGFVLPREIGPGPAA
jgi:hypothetical protein